MKELIAFVILIFSLAFVWGFPGSSSVPFVGPPPELKKYIEFIPEEVVRSGDVDRYGAILTCIAELSAGDPKIGKDDIPGLTKHISDNMLDYFMKRKESFKNPSTTTGWMIQYLEGAQRDLTSKQDFVDKVYLMGRAMTYKGGGTVKTEAEVDVSNILRGFGG